MKKNVNKEIKQQIKNELREKNRVQEVINANKLLLVFVMAFLGIFYILYLEKMASYGSTLLISQRITSIVKYLVSGVFVISGAIFAKDTKEKKQYTNHYVNPRTIFSISAVAFVCAMLIEVLSIYVASKLICLLLAAVAVLYFVNITYAKDMFVLAYANMATLIATYVMSTINSINGTFIISILSIVNLCLVLVLINKAEKGPVFGITLFNNTTNYKWLKINAIILMAITALAVLLALANFNYGFVACIIYFAIIVFYNTIKIL